MNRELQYIFTKYNMTVSDITTVHELLYNEFKEEVYWVTKNKNTGENLAREKVLHDQLKRYKEENK